MTVYQLGIVGEVNYQPAIRRCSAGERVDIVHEPDNPYDGCALAVVTMTGETIGYVPRACWLRDAIHDEGKGCEATIRSINTAARGLFGVVLDVTLNTDGISERKFKRGSASQIGPASEPPKSWLSRLLRG